VPPKPVRPARHGVCFWLERRDGSVLFRRRPSHGLLGGMMELPTTPWRTDPWSAADAVAMAPTAVAWQPVPGHVDHAFTHFALTLAVFRARAASPPPDGVWAAPAEFDALALPTLFRKVVAFVGRGGDA
jgi:A/G-specific adenine glycosylase